MLLDQYGAADVLVAEVQLQRLWPGGPAIGTFTARHGPDNEMLGRIVLRVENSAAIPHLLDEGVRRLDMIYAAALAGGQLRPDPTLIMPEAPPVEATPEEPTAETEAAPTAQAPVPAGTTTTFSIQ